MMKPSEPIWPLGEWMKHRLIQLYERAVKTNSVVKEKLRILVQRLIEAKLQSKPTKIQVAGDLIELFSKLIAINRLREPNSPFTQEVVFEYEQMIAKKTNRKAQDEEIGQFILKMLSIYEADDLYRIIHELMTDKPLSVIFGFNN